MPVVSRISVALACAAAAVATAAAAAPASAAPAPNVIRTGHCLAASATRPVDALQSSNQRFELVLDRRELRIHNEVLLSDHTAAGYTTWDRIANAGHADSARLCMQRDGNLVLRGNGTVAWSSHTAGTGTHNDAVIRDTGALVVRTGAGRVVWSTNTTAVLLSAGDLLGSGRELRNYTDPSAVTHLTMRPDGDLTLTRGSVVVWRTDTNVAGSHLTVLANGQLAVAAPDGRTVWRSSGVGSTPLLTVANGGRILLESYASGRCWVRPAGSNCA